MQFWLSFYKQLNYSLCHSFVTCKERASVYASKRGEGKEINCLISNSIWGNTRCTHTRSHKQFIDAFRSEYVGNLWYVNAHLWLLLVSDFCIIFEVFDVLLQSSCICTLHKHSKAMLVFQLFKAVRHSWVSRIAGNLNITVEMCLFR